MLKRQYDSRAHLVEDYLKINVLRVCGSRSYYCGIWCVLGKCLTYLSIRFGFILDLLQACQ